MKNKFKLFLLIIALVVILTGCMPGDSSYTMVNPAGFLSGIWHGWIAPISLIISFFSKDRGIYEVVNTGFWYDFAFYMAIISGFGGMSLSRRKKRRKYRKKR